tara:strand:+ start:266 stop:460 length:195 start_codon:yes stop_codon:yes gene_type:complete
MDMVYNIAIAILFIMMLLINYTKNKDIRKLKDDLSLLNSEYNALYNQKAQHDIVCPLTKTRQFR